MMDSSGKDLETSNYLENMEKAISNMVTPLASLSYELGRQNACLSTLVAPHLFKEKEP